MKKIVVLLMFLIYAGNFVAQTPRERVKRIELQKSHESPKTKTAPAEDSPFFGYDNTIKEILLKESSINQVPARAQNQSKAEYLQTLNNWIKLNSSLIRPEKRNIEVN